MVKYKIGDRVRVISNLQSCKVYWNEDHIAHEGATKQMVEMAGQIVTISDVRNSGKYCIWEDCGTWIWTDEMFEELEKLPMSRGDIIRNMSDIELASFLEGLCATCSYKNMKSCKDKSCFKGALNWLKEKGDRAGFCKMNLQDAEAACKRLRIGGYSKEIC